MEDLDLPESEAELPDRGAPPMEAAEQTDDPLRCWLVTADGAWPAYVLHEGRWIVAAVLGDVDEPPTLERWPASAATIECRLTPIERLDALGRLAVGGPELEPPEPVEPEPAEVWHE